MPLLTTTEVRALVANRGEPAVTSVSPDVDGRLRPVADDERAARLVEHARAGWAAEVTTQRSCVMTEKVFTVEIEVHERPDHAWAKALLELDGRTYGGWGRARRNPADPERPRLGEELAVARALTDLAHQLGTDVDAEIEPAEGKPAHVHL